MNNDHLLEFYVDSISNNRIISGDCTRGITIYGDGGCVTVVGNTIDMPGNHGILFHRPTRCAYCQTLNEGETNCRNCGAPK